VSAYHSGTIKDTGGEFIMDVVAGMPIYGSSKNNGLQSKLYEGTDFGLKFTAKNVDEFQPFNGM
jgi:hypothetical protein